MAKVLYLLILAALLFFEESTAHPKGGHHCPKRADKFERKVKKCYLPLSGEHDSTDPKEYCDDYNRILTCVYDLVENCRHRDWMDEARTTHLDDRMGQLTDMIQRTC